jgi:hypothetical protein
MTFGRTGMTADATSLARTPTQSAAVPVAIDALLGRGELAEVTRSLRASARTRRR